MRARGRGLRSLRPLAGRAMPAREWLGETPWFGRNWVRFPKFKVQWLYSMRELLRVAWSGGSVVSRASRDRLVGNEGLSAWTRSTSARHQVLPESRSADLRAMPLWAALVLCHSSGRRV